MLFFLTVPEAHDHHRTPPRPVQRHDCARLESLPQARGLEVDALAPSAPTTVGLSARLFPNISDGSGAWQTHPCIESLRFRSC